MDEASSHPQKHYLTFEDFANVVSNIGDFDQMMYVQLCLAATQATFSLTCERFFPQDYLLVMCGGFITYDTRWRAEQPAFASQSCCGWVHSLNQ
jgi:hypothetical protein